MKDWQLLKAKCPRLYKNDMYFECGLGWYNILNVLSIKIERILDKYAENAKIPKGEDNENCEIYAVQVKEKYGRLRFYMSWEDDEIRELIKVAELLSTQVCEKCGARGKIRSTGWLETNCDKCFKEKRNE